MKRFILLACLVLTPIVIARPDHELPVFLADNHAETFAWIARTFDPDQAHQMVLVDAHSDASAAERSEELREDLRRVANEKERDGRVESWRDQGRIQAFNWIEPLMPRPLDRVLWLAAPALDEESRALKQRNAGEELDGRLEVEPRSSGSLASRWDVCDLKGYAAWKPGNKPVILAIDLDFFAGMDRIDREKHFEAIWEHAMDWPGLSGVAFAVSRPWLKNDEEADDLVELAIDAVARTRGAILEIDTRSDERADHSLQAKRFREQGKPIPRWDFGHASDRVKLALLGLGSDRLSIRDPEISWGKLSGIWTGRFGRASITTRDLAVDCDGVFRCSPGKEPVLRVEPKDGIAELDGRVRWYLLEPARAAYDFLPGTGLGKDFSASPARWIYEKRRILGQTEDFQLDPARWAGGKPGRYRIVAECAIQAGWLKLPPVDICVAEDGGFRGALSECMHMPYVFGIAGVAEEGLSGVETGWGSDCANLLVHAWRRQGIPLVWGDPARLREQLQTKAEKVRVTDAVKITPEEIENGIAIDFGRHVAALWEDREPIGVLDGNDLALHHLGGFPEIVTLSVLAEKRPLFALRIPREGGCRIAFAGDVVLAGDDRVVIDGFGKGDADAFFVNLEGIPSLKEPDKKPRYDFRFPAERLAWLKQQGVDLVSLANNHAMDAGPAGLLEGLAACREAGLAVVGAGHNAEEACQPWRGEFRGVKLSVFGISLLQESGTEAEEPAVANVIGHRKLLAEEFRKARARGERIVTIVHGGDEYDPKVTEEQRDGARWLASQGAAIVAGAHPHVLQREETHAGARIFHSLGNAVYPRELKGADSGTVRVAEIPPVVGFSR
ncbi:CapA family protein [Luteolibacter luteus]|uniref:Capsule synthesis protein CapA domain-containing protein n=1 Tax=Luteolibacter luteus TaxID=2728835 RepID=A0A858RID5_9BACT|nr:CapA family protein [Luteolibacter luteus]QJE96304.1 hypothetical protein HHL09_11075 [Luteolibacter luteus]